MGSDPSTLTAFSAAASSITAGAPQLSLSNLSTDTFFDGIFRLVEWLETTPSWETIPVCTALVVGSEMVPLLPTQPFALAAGLLFGAKEGFIVVLAGNVLAASLAFGVSRIIGSKAATWVMALEGEGGESNPEDMTMPSTLSPLSPMGEKTNNSSDGNTTNNDSDNSKPKSLVSRLDELKAKIEKGTFKEQTTTVFLYRLTPHPFSASNYLFGLMPLRPLAYVAGTAGGMLPWAALYASVGATGRSLLSQGEALSQVFAELGEEVEGPLKMVGMGIGVAALCFVGYTVVTRTLKSKANVGGEATDQKQ